MYCFPDIIALLLKPKMKKAYRGGLMDSPICKHLRSSTGDIYMHCHLYLAMIIVLTLAFKNESKFHARYNNFLVINHQWNFCPIDS